jgi:catechol 2,3-dioxygenase-like lactoylglutathione lyase family enzyme
MSQYESEAVQAFVPSRDLEQAKIFYTKLVGARVEDEDEYAVTLRVGDGFVRVVKVEDFQPQPFTVCGIVTDNVGSVARYMIEHGVEMVHYEGMGQDGDGVWEAPSGDRIAWFRDPDGNLLSYTEHGAPFPEPLTGLECTHKRQTCGGNAYACVVADFEPRDSGYQLVNEVPDKLPAEYAAALSAGIRDELHRINPRLRVVVRDARTHKVDSSAYAFRMCGHLLVRLARERRAEV